MDLIILASMWVGIGYLAEGLVAAYFRDEFHMLYPEGEVPDMGMHLFLTFMGPIALISGLFFLYSQPGGFRGFVHPFSRMK